MTNAVRVTRRDDGSLLLAAAQPLRRRRETLVDWLDHWAEAAPGRAFLRERGSDGHWHDLAYGQARDDARHLGAWLLRQGLGPSRPLMILCANGLAHARLALAALWVGVPVAPVAPAYALRSPEGGKLQSVVASLQPGLVLVDRREPFEAALGAVAGLADFKVAAAADLDAVRTSPGDLAAAEAARRRVDGATVAKVLFTSGSTGQPKGVINTHAMWAANADQMAQAWPFMAQEPPVLLDWLPWNHTFGGNHNFGFTLSMGGTLHIDDGKATEEGIRLTARNLREVSPTAYFNVPRGFELLLPLLEQDDGLRTAFFRRLKFIESAAAALPAATADALLALARRTTGRPVPLVNGWGATETAPVMTMTPLAEHVPGSIGLPVAGAELKLLPLERAQAGQYEVRVRGPNVFPGYWRRPELTPEVFDEEGFYRIGDIVRCVDPAAPERGLTFAGRGAEEFKLSTGTWVQAASVRAALVEALRPLAQDAAIAGENRDELVALVFPNWEACRRVAQLGPDAGPQELARHPAVRAAVQDGLAAAARSATGSSTLVRRVVLQVEPPSFDRGEATEKGSLNQRRVVQLRAADVEAAYAAEPGDNVISPPVPRS